MVSALLMLRRVVAALRYAAREEDFVPVVSAGAHERHRLGPRGGIAGCPPFPSH
jgi:hypothetical protein